VSDSKADHRLPRYPVYVTTKNRYQWERAVTARMLAQDGVPFVFTVETPQVEQYRELARRLEVPEDCVLDMGFQDLGLGVSSARNWCLDHARSIGAARHWQLDDNSAYMYRVFKGDRYHVRSGVALAAIEDFTDRYTNIGLSGPNYAQFIPTDPTPFYQNVHVYSCTLIDNAIDCRWRGPYNEDTDMCLQVLAAGLCTVLVNVFLLKKLATFQTNGKRTSLGGMSELYEGDGRLRMARSLEQRWPHVVTVDRRWRRPQHVVDWRRFDTPLQRRTDIDFDAFPKVDNYGMQLTATKEIRSERLRQFVEDQSQ
jgi:hypothetical protein